MSKSFGRRASSRSRTLPPTRYAMNPASFSRYKTFSASGSTSRRDSGCSDRGMMVGSTMATGLYQMPGCLHIQVHALQRVSAYIVLAVLGWTLQATPVGAQPSLDFPRQLYNQGRYE